jgi:PhnB protein
LREEFAMSCAVQSSAVLRTTIAPLLSVREGARAIDFYGAAFGAETLMRIDDPDGNVVAKLSVGGAEFWLADESVEHGNFSPASLGGSTVRMVLTVEDPDAVQARAVAAGAAEVWPVADQSYGWRVGRIADPFGHHWEIGKPLAG